MKAQLSVVAIAALFINAAWISPSIPPAASTRLSVEKPSTPVSNFAFFRTHRQAQGIMTTWGLSSNAGVTGFLVQKTYEDPTDPYAYWEDICAMPCGAGRSFKHHDLNVFPGFISYRVIAFLQGGGSIVSAISMEHIVRH